MLDALNSGDEFKQAANEAEVFDDKLESALRFSAPAGLLDDILAIPGGSNKPQEVKPQRRRWAPMALAASLLVAVVSSGMMWKQSRDLHAIESYLADHYQKDGTALLVRADARISVDEISKVMAALNVETDSALADRIRFIRFCPTPGGQGAHMVVSTDHGPVTIIFMPDTSVKDKQLVEFGEMHALLVALQVGSAAIIGDMRQPVSSLDSVVRNSIVPSTQGV
jgi:hypothetical protein